MGGVASNVAEDSMRMPLSLDVRLLLKLGPKVLTDIGVWVSPKAGSRPTVPALLDEDPYPPLPASSLADPIPTDIVLASPAADLLDGLGELDRESAAPGALVPCALDFHVGDVLDKFVERRAFTSTMTTLTDAEIGDGDLSGQIKALVDQGVLVRRAADTKEVFEDQFSLRDEAYTWNVSCMSDSILRALNFTIGDGGQLKSASKLTLLLHLVPV